MAEMQLMACPKSMKKGDRLGLKIIVAITYAVVVGTLILLLHFIQLNRCWKFWNSVQRSSPGRRKTNCKVLNHEQIGASKSFMAECEGLRKTRHKNVLKIITVCSSVNHAGDDFKALVFEYMPNGSLEDWLHSREDASHQEQNLSLSQRLNIAIDVACALEYLHHHCETPIVHCDLKPGNVLIDEDMTAQVGDFGLAKFLTVNCSNSDGGQTNSLAIKGSIGYVAPGKVSLIVPFLLLYFSPFRHLYIEAYISPY
ncbi:probable LRR receptor-like serine/threonine-protein kinase At3g47570 [Rhododendron vialii]|uniref:probable LRR receptor-like serine/threonine-protein kinase At3g47570 n=1 Tax=Rhododendron vialii TaxID=182163 RepID=UPI00265FBF2F|nr:probable LRR receptor-like serine/threonine-protein kinase At3g47570 [Rhododendron vialii]